MIAGYSSRPYAARSRYAVALLVLSVIAAFSASYLYAGDAHSQSCQAILAGGDFSNASIWTSQSSGSYALIDGFEFRSAPVAAHLGGVNNAVDSIGTTISLPPDTPAFLEFWWYVDTVDDDDSAGFDYLAVEIADSSGNLLRQLPPVFSNYDAVSYWKSATASLAEFAGQSIQIRFVARTDARNISDFYVDDVSVTACDLDVNVFLPFAQR